MLINPELIILQDASEVASTVAGSIITALSAGIVSRGRASLVLAGGSTFTTVYSILSSDEYVTKLDWSKVTFFFGDERCVEPTNSLSNYGAAYSRWLYIFDAFEKKPTMYRIEAEKNPEDALIHYEDSLRGYGFGELPTFDCVLLGLGIDGHTASLFQGSRYVWREVSDAVVVVEPDVEPFVPRISLTPYVLNKTYTSIIVAVGKSKKEIVTKVLGDTVGTYASSYLHAKLGHTFLFVDVESAPNM